MFSKIAAFAFLVLISLTIYGLSVTASDTAPAGQWNMWRHDSSNTGYQPLPGGILEPLHEKAVFLKGAVTGQPVFACINDESVIFFIDSGKVKALNAKGQDLWISDFLLAKTVYTVGDLNGNGKYEVLVFGEKQLIVLDALTGRTLFVRDFQDQPARPRFMLHDFDGDRCQEAVIWIYDDPQIYIIKFTDNNGELIVNDMNYIDGGEYLTGQYYPGFARADINKDGYDEFILIRHGGISIYDAKTFSSQKGAGIKPVSRLDYIPEGADNGRFYGYFKMIDVTGDGIPDGVILADGVSMHVGVMQVTENSIKKIWDKYYGYSGKSDAQGKSVIMRVVNDGLINAKGDDRKFLTYGIFEYTDGSATGTWNFKIINATNLNDPGNIELKGYYLWGVEDIGSGNPLFFLSKENVANPGEPSEYEIYSFDDHGSFIKIADISRTLPKKLIHMPGNVSPASYSGEYRLYTVDVNNDGVMELLTYKNGTYEVISISKTKEISVLCSFKAPGRVYADFKDIDNNVLFIADDGKGKMSCVDLNGNILWEYRCGGPVNASALIGNVTGDDKNSLVLAVDGVINIYSMQKGGPYSLKSSIPGIDPILVDMNNDGTNEIIVKSTKGGKPGFSVLNASGIELWSYYVDKDQNGQSLGFTALRDIAVGDVTGDGTIDVVLGLQNTYPLGRTAIIDGATHELIYITPATVQIGYVHAGGGIVDRATLAQPGRYALADIDKDGKDEIYFVSLEAFMRITMTDDKKFKLDTYVAQINADKCRIYYSTPYIFDVNGNDTKDFIFGAGFNSVSVFPGNMKMSFVTPKSFPLWDLVVSNNNELMYRQQGIAPIEIKGNIYAAVGIQYASGEQDEKGTFVAYDGKTGTVLWRYDLKKNFGGSNVLTDNILSCDIDNDGKVEFIVSTNTGYVIALRSDKDLPVGNDRVLWSVNVGAAVSNIAIGDVFNDGKSDIVITAHDGFIHVISGSGDVLNKKNENDFEKNNRKFSVYGVIIFLILLSLTLTVMFCLSKIKHKIKKN